MEDHENDLNKTTFSIIQIRGLFVYSKLFLQGIQIWIYMRSRLKKS